MLTQKRLRELLTYNPMTGSFTNNVKRGPLKIGDILGSVNANGYSLIMADSKRHPAHRLAFLYMTGGMPTSVDHINHCRDDNRWKNLRAIDRQGNAQNKTMYRQNKSGHTGIHWRDDMKKWLAQIQEKGVKHHLGSFDNFTDAVAARQTAEDRMKFHRNHGTTQ